MTPFFYWAFLALLLGTLYSGFRIGRAIGRAQEYHKRTSPLLAELVWVKEVTDMNPPVAAQHISYRAGAVLAKYGLKKS